MKAKQIYALLLAATIITVFSGCEIRKSESSKSSESHTETNLTENHDLSYYQSNYGAFLKRFFTIFSEEEFSSKVPLKSEQMIFFTLSQIVSEYPADKIPFAYDKESDCYIIPQKLTCEKTELYFGVKPELTLSGYPFTYSEEQDAYLYSASHGFPIVYPEIESCQIDHDKVTFHVRYTNPEQEGNPTVKTMDFTFHETAKDGQKYLQADSAVKTGKNLS